VKKVSKYIDREALIAEFKRLKLGENSFIERVFADGVYAIIEQFPAADVTPVVHGRWMPFHSEAAGDIQYCSACEIGFDAKTDYCPHCGAKMDIKDGGDNDAVD
jgi:hypothetical protein